MLFVTIGVCSNGAQGDKAEPSEKELAALKAQRDLANDFMRASAEQAMKNLAKAPKDDKAGKEKADKAAEIRESLQKLLKQGRIFKGGTSRDDLAVFSRALKDADKEGIKVSGEALRELIRAEVKHQINDKEVKSLAESIGKEHDKDVKAIQEFHGKAFKQNADGVLEAVAAEYRVRIVTELKAKKK
jgi:hypothetical protein